jgi:hypothetical protein
MQRHQANNERGYSNRKPKKKNPYPYQNEALETNENNIYQDQAIMQ